MRKKDDDPKVVRNQEIAGILAVVAVLLWVGGAFYLARQDVGCQMVFGDACTVSKAEQARRDNIKLATRGGAILCLSVAGILFVTAAGRRRQ